MIPIIGRRQVGQVASGDVSMAPLDFDHDPGSRSARLYYVRVCVCMSINLLYRDGLLLQRSFFNFPNLHLDRTAGPAFRSFL